MGSSIDRRLEALERDADVRRLSDVELDAIIGGWQRSDPAGYATASEALGRMSDADLAAIIKAGTPAEAQAIMDKYGVKL